MGAARMPNIPEKAIEAIGLSKTFRLGFFARKVIALRDATFVVKRGATVGLVGPNGAGKTTTIKALLGLIKPSSGTAFIAGHRTPTLASRSSLGYLPENPRFYDHLRPAEYLMFAGSLCGMTRREARQRADVLIDFVGLSGAEKKPIRKFSKGMVQRLGIAQTLIHDPEIVILDEPQSGLDPIGRKEVKDMILDLKRRGRTVFFSSHILHDVEDVCDEIVAMFNGRVRARGDVETLLDRNVIETEVEIAAESDELRAELTKEATSVRPSGGSTRYHFDGNLAEDRVQYFRESGAQVLQLIRHREQLEDLFVREAGVDDSLHAEAGGTK